MVRYHVIFTGRVQGVGFRYTTQEFAESAGVFGWVRNLPDRSVEMVAEGDKVVLDGLMSRIRDHFGGHIRDCLVQELPATGEFLSFDIVS